MSSRIRDTDPNQDDEQLQEVAAAVREVLTPDEEIIYVAFQDQKAPVLKKAAAIATNHRVILYKPSMIGSFNFWDSHWQDVEDVHLKQGMIFSDITIRTIKGDTTVLEKANKDQARRFYSYAQHYEHEWRERRRQRRIEEDRARAGGITIQSPTATAPQSAGSQAEDPVAKLQKAKQMLDAGLISQAEYDEVKQRILAEM